MKFRFVTLTVVSSVVFVGPVFAQSNTSQIESCGHTIFSVWDAGNGTEISIIDCGDLSPCGRITKLSDPDLTDGNNRDAALQRKPLLGRLILSGFRESRDGWKRGNIYNPSNGKSYKSSIRLQSDDLLLVKGCIGPFCEKQTWTRISKKKCPK